MKFINVSLSNNNNTVKYQSEMHNFLMHEIRSYFAVVKNIHAVNLTCDRSGLAGGGGESMDQ